jgi:uncharacterized membrane protein
MRKQLNSFKEVSAPSIATSAGEGNTSSTQLPAQEQCLMKERRKRNERGYKSTKARMIQALIYELVALSIIAPAYHFTSGTKAEEALSLLVILSLIVLGWTLIFNRAYDAIEHRFDANIHESNNRPLGLRILHAIGMELGLMIISIPIIKVFLGITWMEALLLDIYLTVAYMVYALCFFYVYDKISAPIERRSSVRREALASLSPEMV